MTRKPKQRRGRWRRLVVPAAVVLILLVGGAATAFHAMTSHYLGQVDRIPDPFASIPASTRPSPSTNGDLTLLITGLDTISKVATTGSDAQVEPSGRSDVLMVVRIPADRRRAYVISIPRDSWVPIPGHGEGKINASFAKGGATLAIQTVEKLTKLHIDHVAIIDWSGFRALTDAVGGVRVDIPSDTYDPSQGVSFAKGEHVLDGEQALYYVRQRYGLPNGDLDRIRRQQNFLRALMSQLMDRETLTDPSKLGPLMSAFAKTVSVDSGFSNNDLFWLATDAPKLREGVRFLTVPITGFARVGEESTVQLNLAKNQALWKAVGDDRLEEYLAANTADVLGEQIR